ncbi:MAG: ribosome silencing factor [Phycisphaerae bacterium]
MTESTNKIEARDLAVEAARIAADMHCEDIVVLDLKGISPVTNYFVIGTGTSGRQIRSVAQEIAGFGKANGSPVWRTAGMENPEWVILDFVDVVVHLFDPEHRRYYDLELIWGEGPAVEWRREDQKESSNTDSDSDPHPDPQ